jgi:hypothetical protein
VNGAPKIDDRAAWAPRMTNGVDATVRSAIRGHGAMPARGGLVDLTDSELRAAILYMFYPAGAALKAQAAPPPVRDPNHKTVGGVDFYLGISPAPLGRGYYYVSITLREGAAQAYVKDAAVEARAANAVTGGETKKLEPMTVEQALSYGNSFRMEGKEPYTISVRALRPGRAAPLETAFQFKP